MLYNLSENLLKIHIGRRDDIDFVLFHIIFFTTAASKNILFNV